MEHQHTPSCASGHTHRQIPVPKSFTAQPSLPDLTTLLPQLQRDGYICVPSLLPPHLLLAAQAASKYLVMKTRTGTLWPYVRTVGKQYPPWPVIDVQANKAAAKARDQAERAQRAAAARTGTTTDLNVPESGNVEVVVPNIWGIQYLLHPALEQIRTVYAEIYFSDPIINIIQHLLADPQSPGQPVSEDELVLELFNLLISPTRHENFELEWHRDDIRPEVDVEEETTLLNGKAPGGRQLHAQYNIALFEDSSLIVIPGSHKRPRTEAERKAGRYESLPSEVRVHLKPGDAVFYDSNILHRAIYKGIDESEDLGRMTLHGSVGLSGYGKERSRQVLQHGISSWIKEDTEEGFGIEDEAKRQRAIGMRQRLLEMGAQNEKNVGYSLEG